MNEWMNEWDKISDNLCNAAVDQTSFKEIIFFVTLWTIVMRYWPFFVNRALEIIYCDDDSDDDDLKTHLFASCVSALVH